VLTWATKTGSVAIVWRSDDPIALRLADFAQTVEADVIINVDPDLDSTAPRFGRSTVTGLEVSTTLRFAISRGSWANLYPTGLSRYAIPNLSQNGGRAFRQL
jgi:hypothetical protein